jgi:hypothetical protein
MNGAKIEDNKIYYIKEVKNALFNDSDRPVYRFAKNIGLYGSVLALVSASLFRKIRIPSKYGLIFGYSFMAGYSQHELLASLMNGRY